VLSPDAALEVLGVRSGAPADEQFLEAAERMSAVHSALGVIEDTGVELTLARSCADVCRLVHLLRARGPEVAALGRADRLLDAVLESVLASPVPLAAPAYVAARVDARPLVAELFAKVPRAWGADGDARAPLLSAYDARTDAAAEDFRASLSPASAAHLGQVLAEAAELAAERVRQLTRPPRPVDPDEAPVPLVDEVSTAGTGPGAHAGLQAKLSALVDGRHLDALTVRFRAIGAWSDLRRLGDLGHPDCDHDWLLALHPGHGAHLSSDEYGDSLRVRLGLDFIAAPAPCEACDHALLCAPGECTRT
jgi:hypothetical protein